MRFRELVNLMVAADLELLEPEVATLSRPLERDNDSTLR